MSSNQNKQNNKEVVKSEPAYLSEHYPYKATESVITNIDTIDANQLYEINCSLCKLCIRTQGKNIKKTYTSLMKSGCVGCGNTELIVRMVDVKKL